MKTITERTDAINGKVKNKIRRKKYFKTAIGIACAAVFVTLLFAPVFGAEGVPNINAYKNDSYYPLIAKLNENSYHNRKKPSSLFMNFISAFAPAKEVPPDSDGNASAKPGNKYEETTLNQYKGITEGDLLKRSSQNVFYLRFENVPNDVISFQNLPCLALDVYDINKNDTKLLATHYICSDDDAKFEENGNGYIESEMYLSEDASVVSVIANCRSKSDGAVYTCVISLDVSDVSDIAEIGRKYVSGEYLSSRKVDGKLVVITNFSIYKFSDYEEKTAYVPSCGEFDDFLPMEDIYCPQYVNSRSYTVVAELDEKTQSTLSQYAMLSYSQDVNVSSEYIFVARSLYCTNEKNYCGTNVHLTNGQNGYSHYVTEILALKYGSQLEKVGGVFVDGSVKDRYSLDEKDGVLRVVTTIRHSTVTAEGSSLTTRPTGTSASLFCVDLSSMEIIAKVDAFAPDGEEVKSVRFDGDNAYVCTAVRMTDPVFAFDLSNLDDIKVKDTGTIPGFSISLIPFSDKLLGIGHGESE